MVVELLKNFLEYLRQNLLDSDYEICMVCLLVATVNWRKSIQFAKKSNIPLLPCFYDYFMIYFIILQGKSVVLDFFTNFSDSCQLTMATSRRIVYIS